MDFKIPEPLKVAHKKLHTELANISKAPGRDR